ncbi:MAG: 23S rRNA (uracil(1939)-C(5))-methyltransferase RlmD [Desulfobacteraceae bacterium]|nr:MAG: 23S rRNA (uracil(1939)-C(5))-methyltransferase RlmD [Desulfobacteraceae bacterium]
MNTGKGTLIELSVENVAFGGNGVARRDGFVFFVKGGLPGDRVLARILKKKKTYAETAISEILEPSTDRIDPPCPYFGRCGGCKLQHASYTRQLQYKKTHVAEAMAHIALLPHTVVRETVPSWSEYGYRNKMEFSFSTRPWLPLEEFVKGSKEEGFALGLHVPGSFDKVLDIDACLLQPEMGNRILRTVKRFAQSSGLPAYGIRSHEGFWRFLAVRHSGFLDEWMVNVITSTENRPVMESLARMLLGECAAIGTIVNNISQRKASIAVGEREIVLHGKGTITDRLGEFQFLVSANSFFQTNSRTALKLYEKVAEYADLKGNERVLDLYSGTGTIPIFLSRAAGEVLGMEINAIAVQDAEKNCRLNEISNCRFVIGDIRETLAGSKYKPDVLVIDPPRDGMHKDVLAAVLRLQSERVVYVSCNPSTLARDLRIMTEEYEILEVQPFDMFPHTYHVESVVKLVRRRK